MSDRISPQSDNGASGALLALFVVLVAGVVSAWWWGHGALGDFSLINQILPYIMYSDPAVRPQADVGATTTPPSETPEADAPYCRAGQQPDFVLGFAELDQRIGDVMGTPLECEHNNPANGDTLQQTTTGLAVYEPTTSTLSFTDGWRHWALRGGELTTWQGSDAPPTPTPASWVKQPSQQVRVVNTDGVGVVLRSAPVLSARLPAGFADGTVLTLMERKGEWVEVRSANGRQGWLPAQYVQAVVPSASTNSARATSGNAPLPG